jgi:hypothetical protein
VKDKNLAEHEDMEATENSPRYQSAGWQEDPKQHGKFQ